MNVYVCVYMCVRDEKGSSGFWSCTLKFAELVPDIVISPPVRNESTHIPSLCVGN